MRSYGDYALAGPDQHLPEQADFNLDRFSMRPEKLQLQPYAPKMRFNVGVFANSLGE